MPIPEPVCILAADVLAGRPRRLKVKTLLGYYGLRRRRESGMLAIRDDLRALGVTTSPEFETADFDGQVRVIPASGAPPDTGAETIDLADEPYRISMEPGAAPRTRVLLRMFDAFERLRQHIVASRCAQVFENGQNPWRADRDAFPFHMILALKEEFSQSDLED